MHLNICRNRLGKWEIILGLPYWFLTQSTTCNFHRWWFATRFIWPNATRRGFIYSLSQHQLNKLTGPDSRTRDTGSESSSLAMCPLHSRKKETHTDIPKCSILSSSSYTPLTEYSGQGAAGKVKFSRKLDTRIIYNSTHCQRSTSQNEQQPK